MEFYPRWKGRPADDPPTWKHQVVITVDGKGPYLWSRHVKLSDARAERDGLLSQLKGVRAHVLMRYKEVFKHGYSEKEA